MFAALFAAFALLVSCEKVEGDTSGQDSEVNTGDDEGDGGDEDITGGDLEDLKENTVVVNGEERTLTAVFVEEYSGVLMVTATDAEGAESFEWLVDNEKEYIQLLAMPSLYNREFDVMTETDVFSVFSMYEDAPLYDGAGPGVTEGLESGKCRLDFDGENAELFADLKLADGSSISVRAKGVFTGEQPVEENYIIRNDDKNPLRAAFYSVEDGLGMFYFTPADIDYFDEIEMASYYVCVILYESMVNDGTTVDVSVPADPSTGYYEIYYVDNATGDVRIVPSGGEDGSFTISRGSGSEASFNAVFDVKFAEDLSVSFEYHGEMTDMNAVPAKENQFVFDGNTYPLSSVVVDAASEPWTIWLSSQAGINTVDGMASADPVKITAPSEAFNGESVGFSTYKNTLAFEYGGNVWNYGSGALGTLTVSLDGDAITLEFTDYEGFNGYFSGTCTVLK